MPFRGVLDADIEETASHIVDAAFRVHKEFGPGLLEDIYEVAMAYELAKRGRSVVRQSTCRIYYDGVELRSPLKIDLIIDGRVIIEVKAVEKLIPIHTAQCITYLKLTGRRLCLLINFNVELIKDGITRVIN